MKRFLFFSLLFSMVCLRLSADDTVAEINLQHKKPHDHNEHYIPADQPDVYYDSDNLEIILVADGFSSYYDVYVDSIPTTIGYYYKNSSSNNGYYRQLKLTKSMVVLNNASPNWPIVIYKHNYLPYIAPLYLQNVNFNKSQYVIATDVTAGHSVDSNRTSGDVTVKNGVQYEIEASGNVTLEDGFTVEKGATFAVYPSSF